MISKNCISLVGICSLALGLSLLLPQTPVWAQTVVATVPVAGTQAVAVNSVTNRIYVAGVTVIDGATNTTTEVPAGGSAVAVNTVTNKIYTVTRGNPIKGPPSNITVIDGTTNATTTVTDPNATFPSAVAVNPVTNKIYVTNLEPAGGAITVIDGDTNSTTTVKDPNASSPVAVAVNLVTNKIYVANVNSGNVTVIDGATNSTTTVQVTSTSGLGPAALAVNPLTNKIYVANNGVIRNSTNVGNITVIDGDTNSTTTVTDPNAITPVAVAVNPSTNKIYVTNVGNFPGANHGNVTVIDGTTNSTTTVTDPNALAPLQVEVNPETNKIYVTNGNSSALSGNGGVTVIDGATNSTTTVTDPNAKTDLPAAIAVDPATDRIYVANAISNNVTVIDGGIAPPPSFDLSVVGSGNGGGVVMSNPTGINCGNSCSASFVPGSLVILTASPASGSTFSNWSGACSGAGACSITMTADESVTATFSATPPDFSLSAASMSLTVPAGGQKSDVITIAPQNGFANAIQLSCAVSGPSPMLTCALSPASLPPDANSPTSTLMITAPASAMVAPSLDRNLSGYIYAALPPLPAIALIGIGVISHKKRDRRRNLWLLAASLIVLLAAIGGCGGGSNTPPPPARNYTVTVTGTSGAIQHTLPVTVTVQ